MKWFKNVDFQTPIEDIKKQYLRLCKLHHPDLGGSVEDMAAINAEYEQLQRHHYNIHRGKDGQVYTDERQDAPTEDASQFTEWISSLLKMGLTVEVCGSWLWITGDTRTHKDELKAMGCYYSGSKKCWYMHPKETKKYRHHRAQSMDRIRDKYGSRTFTAASDSSKAIVL